MRKDRIIKIVTEACRIMLGAAFVFSGAAKAIDPVGSAIKIEDYLGAFHLSSLNSLAMFFSVNLIAVEFALGVCILAAVYRRITTLCMLVFMSFMTLLTLYLALFNPVHDCGCFGDAFILTNWQTFFKNALLLLPAAIVTYLFHKKMTPLYTGKAHWFVALFAYAFAVGFEFWNYNHLPITDFRPFKIGANIPEAMSFPADAEQDQYEFVYVKNGERRAFALEEAPASDSTWTFVEAKLLKKGYVPPITSFELYDAGGDNVAGQILSETGGAFLLISPKLEKASDKHIDEINNIYDYAVEKNIPFYCVTSSSEDGIEAWINNTGAEYPFLAADDVTLKTIIRSNPGLVLLKGGTILMKWHHNDIPPEKTADAFIDGFLGDGGDAPRKENGPWIWTIGCFALTLSLAWIYDCLRNRVKWRKKRNSETI